MITSIHFAPWEVLPDISEETTWESLDPEIAAQLHPNLLPLAEQIREIIGAFTVNNYHSGGSRRFCGLRDARCAEYSPTSKHATGEAVDGHPLHCSAEEARQAVLVAARAGKLPLLGRIELDVPWFHFDLGPRVNGQVHCFSKSKPKSKPRAVAP